MHDCRVQRKGDRSVVPWAGGRRRESSYGHAGHQIRGSRETKPEAILRVLVRAPRAASVGAAEPGGAEQTTHRAARLGDEGKKGCAHGARQR